MKTDNSAQCDTKGVLDAFVRYRAQEGYWSEEGVKIKTICTKSVFLAFSVGYEKYQRGRVFNNKAFISEAGRRKLHVALVGGRTI